MKRIFPIITILITLSLLGLIFFQVLWLKSAHEYKLDQLRQNINNAVGLASIELVENNKFVPITKKSDLLFPSPKIPFDIAKSSIIDRYSKDEINDIIKHSFLQTNIGKLPYEFAVASNSILGSREILTNQFYKYYSDSINNIQFTALLIGESGTSLENLAPDEVLIVVVPDQSSIVLKQMGWFILGAVLFTIMIIAAFFITIRTLLRQKKISEIKNDFINNMTHEFKTPLATISLAIDALKNDKVVADKSKADYFTGIIKEENVRMNKQVESILQAALFDKDKMDINLEKQAAHELIKSALSNIELPVKEKSGVLNIKLNAEKDQIMADDVHFTNLINNLLDNALKYSKENPSISLCTSNISNQLRIKIDDNGIGMSKDTLNRIFEKFYRAHTGNLHNVKGFGLGLNYVKKMVLAHKGNIKVESALGKGSSFVINIPLAK